MSKNNGFVRILLSNPAALVGLGIFATVGIIAILAPVLFPGDPLAMVGQPLLWPGQSSEYILGTDALGRDVLAGIAHGSRASVLVGIAAASIGLVLGTVIGATAGYFGGWIDDLLVRATEVLQTFPPFILVIVLVAIGQPSVTTVTLAIGFVSWPSIARLVRAEFRSLRQRDFVLAAQSVGYGHFRIAVGEILPNAAAPLIVISSIMVAQAILNESSLSFLGMGDPNIVTWGTMLGSGREYLRTAWYLTVIPGVAISLTVMALNIIGDGLNDALNPRLRVR